MGAMTGFLGGLGGSVQKQQQKDNVKTPNWGAPNSPTVTPAAGQSPTATTAPMQTAPAPHPVFQGLLPMAQGYYAAHQAKVQDASAQPHVQSLSDPTITPEQQQYHLNSLKTIYAGRPEMLKQYGLQVPTGAVVATPTFNPGITQQ